MIQAPYSTFRSTVMLVSCLLLAPIATATVAPAVQDLADLTSIINAAADAIGDPNNANRGFGVNPTGSSGQMGTADLVNNITSTILRGKFQLDTNKDEWLSSTNIVPVSIALNTTLPSNSTTPTLTLNTSLAIPTISPNATPSASSILPNATLTFRNLTSDLTPQYLEYVQSLPSLSSALIALGRSFHREMNLPVSDAIGGLQLSLSAFQSAMLNANLITSLAVIRTIRASSGLETAQTAWGRPLNLPSGDENDGDATEESKPALTNGPVVVVEPRGEKRRPPPKDGKFYTHQELWNRSEARYMKATEVKDSLYDGVAKSEDGEGQHTIVVAEERVMARRLVV